jgi:hypothetical protein
MDKLPNFIRKPLYYLLILFTTLLIICIIIPIISGFKLYVSYNDSLIKLGELVHVVIKKENNLQFKIGHSDSSYPVKEDYFEVKYSPTGYQNIWFQIVNNDRENVYNNVVVFLDFAQAGNKEKIEINIPDKESFWVKFKEGYFNNNNSPITMIRPQNISQLYSLQFKFKEKGEYIFNCSIFADGYKSVRHIKHFRVIE